MGVRARLRDAWNSLVEGDWRPIGEGWEIRHRPGVGTTVRGGIARAKVPAIRDFFGRDLNPDGPVRVRGSARTPAGVPRLVFSGRWSAFQKQQARNFLIEHLS